MHKNVHFFMNERSETFMPLINYIINEVWSQAMSNINHSLLQFVHDVINFHLVFLLKSGSPVGPGHVR